MIVLGYDFHKNGSIEKPNGLIGQRINKSNRDTSGIFQLFLPPYLIEMFHKFKIDVEVDSVTNIKKKNLKQKWIYPLDCLGDPRGWLGKYKTKKYNSIKSIFSGISKRTIDEVRNNKAVIMIYQPMEGYPSNWLGNDIFKIIYEEIIKYKIRPKNVLYVTGNWILEDDFEKWKPKSKYSEMEDIVVHSFNNERFLDFRNKWDIADLDSGKKRRKHFLCFNRTPRGHRLFLLSLLHGLGIIKKGFVSFDKIRFGFDNFSGYLNNLGAGNNIRTNSVSHLKEFDKGAPYIVDVDEWNTNHFDTSPSWPYEESFFSITTNTLFEEETIFLDEKIWKPILNFHPFIFVGCYNSLQKLKELGFKTFHPFIDESYDEQKHPVKRMMMISKEVERLCSYTLDEMNGWYNQLLPRLKHNHDKLFDQQSLNDFVNLLHHNTDISINE